MRSDDHPPDLKPAPTRILGAGRHATVYETSDIHAVWRVYNDPHRDARIEADLLDHLYTSGYPCPRVLDVNRNAMLLQRVIGHSLAEEVTRTPTQLRAAMRELAALLADLHRIRPPSAFDADRGGTAILHLDLHPHNVLLGPDGPVVIDWTSARRGEGAEDVAQTWLLLATASSPLSHTDDAVVRRLIVEVFLDYVDTDAAAAQLPALASARLKTALPAEEARRLMQFEPPSSGRASRRLRRREPSCEHRRMEDKV